MILSLSLCTLALIRFYFSSDQVDDKDLRQSTHEVAVDAFRASGDPVKMLIRRQVRKTKAVDVTTQTEQETCNDVVSLKKNGWYDPMTITTADLSSTETKEYDSAYDTLNKSSRCSQQAPTLTAPSEDEEESVQSSNTEQTLIQNDPFYKESVSTCSEHSFNKQHGTYLVIDDKENFDMSIGHPTEGEADFECEYEVRFHIRISLPCLKN